VGECCIILALKTVLIVRAYWGKLNITRGGHQEGMVKRRSRRENDVRGIRKK